MAKDVQHESKKTRARRAAKKGAKSSAPIFFDKTIVRMIKKHAPEGTRVTPGAIQLARAIWEHKAVEFARRAYAVSRMLRGEEGVVRAMRRDAELALELSN